MKAKSCRRGWRGLLIFGVGLLLAAVLPPAGPARAQTDQPGQIVLSKVDTSAFPTVTLFMEPRDAYGDFIDGLQAGDVEVRENGALRQLSGLEKSEPGLQIILAVNPTPYMAGTAGGITYYQKLQTALQAWASGQPQSTPDDFSLSTNTGLQVIREKNPTQWAQAVAAYQPVLQTAQPALTSLTQALDLATDPNPNPQMKRVILYITGVPTPANLATIPRIAERAAQQNVRVFVWLVGPAALAASARPPLQQLAQQTGGDLFVYTGQEELPDVEGYLKPQRYNYRLTYQSVVTQTGEQKLSLVVRSGGAVLTSAEQTFAITLQPPNPMFLTPPTRIERRLAAGASRANPQLEPASATIHILVEFPDGRSRPLKRSTLYVDGVKAAENTAEPFDRFTWPLQSYTTGDTHELKVEIEDSLGFVRSSIEIPVEVTVDGAAQPAAPRAISTQRLIWGGVLAAVSAGALLGLVLLRRRRLRKPAPRVNGNGAQRSAGSVSNTSPRPASADVASWPRAVSPRPALAHLIRVSEGGHAVPSSAIPIARSELTLGSDARQANCPFDAPSVSGLHARLRHLPDGSFSIADAGSTAGTWVNYAPVGSQGRRLEHGDLIQLGRVALRFELNQINPAQVRRPRIEPYREDE